MIERADGLGGRASDTDMDNGLAGGGGPSRGAIGASPGSKRPASPQDQAQDLAVSGEDCYPIRNILYILV